MNPAVAAMLSHLFSKGICLILMCRARHESNSLRHASIDIVRVCDCYRIRTAAAARGLPNMQPCSLLDGSPCRTPFAATQPTARGCFQCHAIAKQAIADKKPPYWIGVVQAACSFQSRPCQFVQESATALFMCTCLLSWSAEVVHCFSQK